MRTLLYALGLLAAAPLAAQAQRSPSAFSFGLKGGASLTSLTNRQLESSRYLWGFHAGATGQLSLTERFALQAEVLYSQKGVRDDIIAGGASYGQRLRLHYLDVPVLARLRAGGFFAEAGPQLGLLLTARSQVDYPGYGTAEGTVTDGFNRVELGYVGGLGYQLAHGLGLGLRYNGGLLPVYRNNTYGTTLRNSAFQFYASYQFGQVN